MTESLPSPEFLRKILHYCPVSGILRWRDRDPGMFKNKGLWRSWVGSSSGKRAGCLCGRGYRSVKILGITYQEHRVCWAIFYGHYPKGLIDHINGVRSDNRLLNLRDTSHSGNNRNRVGAKNNRSGATGVSFHKASGKWRVQIGVGRGPKKHIGLFDDFDDAVKARINAESKYGYSDRHGMFIEPRVRDVSVPKQEGFEL